jgi:hypothetical protein
MNKNFKYVLTQFLLYIRGASGSVGDVGEAAGGEVEGIGGAICGA